MNTIAVNDSIVERICSWRRKSLREHTFQHMRNTSEDEATALALQFGLVELELTDESWGSGFPANWHCTITKRRGWLVLSQGHGATRRGALIMALTDLEVTIP